MTLAHYHYKRYAEQAEARLALEIDMKETAVRLKLMAQERLAEAVRAMEKCLKDMDAIEELDGDFYRGIAKYPDMVLTAIESLEQFLAAQRGKEK